MLARCRFGGAVGDGGRGRIRLDGGKSRSCRRGGGGRVSSFDGPLW
jgi:hypothetical protein